MIIFYDTDSLPTRFMQNTVQFLHINDHILMTRDGIIRITNECSFLVLYLTIFCN